MVDDLLQTPIPAEISYGVAIIPTDPLKQKVAAASMDITKSYENDNIIDNTRFPAHVSLFLGGTDRDQIPKLADAIDRAVQPHLEDKFSATRLYTGHGGFIGIEVDNSLATRSLFEAVLHACANVHQDNPRVRPHLIARWRRMKQDQRDLVMRMGTYKLDSSNLHISVALVDERDLNSAFTVAQKCLPLPEDFGIESVQLVDVGHDNEKWSVLWNSGSLRAT